MGPTTSTSSRTNYGQNDYQRWQTKGTRNRKASPCSGQAEQLGWNQFKIGLRREQASKPWCQTRPRHFKIRRPTIFLVWHVPYDYARKPNRKGTKKERRKRLKANWKCEKWKGNDEEMPWHGILLRNSKGRRLINKPFLEKDIGIREKSEHIQQKEKKKIQTESSSSPVTILTR